MSSLIGWVFIQIFDENQQYFDKWWEQSEKGLEIAQVCLCWILLPFFVIQGIGVACDFYGDSDGW